MIEFRPWWYALVCVLDSISTYIGIVWFSAYEANPYMASLMESWGLGVTVIFRAFLGALVAVVLKVWYDHSPDWAKVPIIVATIIFTIGTLAVVTNNVAVITAS